MSSVLAAPCISYVFLYCHGVASANIIFFSKLRQTGTETWKVLKTAYVSETVLLRTLDMIKELAPANCPKCDNTCKRWWICHSWLSNDSKIHGRATCTLTGRWFFMFFLNVWENGRCSQGLFHAALGNEERDGRA